MPPRLSNTPDEPTDVTISSGVNHVMAFFDADEAGLALKELGLTSRVRIKKLGEIFLTAEKDSDALRAEKQLRESLRENLELSGYLVENRASLEESPDGTVRRVTLQSKSLINGMKSLSLDPTNRSVGHFLDPVPHKTPEVSDADDSE